MNLAEILKSKGYDSDEISEIIGWGDNCLDMKVRRKFNIDDEPVHLLDGYYIGDAQLEDVLRKSGKADVEELFDRMDHELRNLVENYPYSSVESWLFDNFDANKFQQSEDNETLEEFQEGDNLGWFISIDNENYYKVRVPANANIQGHDDEVFHTVISVEKEITIID